MFWLICNYLIFTSPYSPVTNSSHFSPYGYWTSRTGEIMNFWAGSVPGSYKCACGYTNTCFEKDKWCNCDSGKINPLLVLMLELSKIKMFGF